MHAVPPGADHTPAPMVHDGDDDMLTVVAIVVLVFFILVLTCAVVVVCACFAVMQWGPPQWRWNSTKPPRQAAAAPRLPATKRWQTDVEGGDTTAAWKATRRPAKTKRLGAPRRPLRNAQRQHKDAYNSDE